MDLALFYSLVMSFRLSVISNWANYLNPARSNQDLSKIEFILATWSPITLNARREYPIQQCCLPIL